MPPNDIGNIKDLVFYRLEVAKADLKAANTLFDIAEYRGANNRAYYAMVECEVSYYGT